MTASPNGRAPHGSRHWADEAVRRTAASEASFARFLGVPFVAVMPASTSREKIALIEAEGGRCHLVADPTPPRSRPCDACAR
jgi:cysteine synthase